MVPIGIAVFTIGLATAIITLVVLISILTSTEGILTAVVTLVVLVGIAVFANGNGTAVVTLVILVGIAVLALGIATAIVTDMVLVGILVAQGRDHFVAQDVLLTILAEDTGFIAVGGTGGRLALLFHGVFVVAVHDGDGDSRQDGLHLLQVFIVTFIIIQLERNGILTGFHSLVGEEIDFQQDTRSSADIICRQHDDRSIKVHIKERVTTSLIQQFGIAVIRFPFPRQLFTVSISNHRIERHTRETWVLLYL